MGSPIHFFVEDIEFKLTESRKISAWLLQVAASYGAPLMEVNYIFVSDEYLLRLNQEFLQHDTYTDIITFPHHAESDEGIGGDVYISIDRIRENAVKFHVSFEKELHRVMVHGLLHLLGLKDKGTKAKAEMRLAEDTALALLEK
jgi:probable rRNA maturation factor